MSVLEGATLLEDEVVELVVEEVELLELEDEVVIDGAEVDDEIDTEDVEVEETGGAVVELDVVVVTVDLEDDNANAAAPAITMITTTTTATITLLIATEFTDLYFILEGSLESALIRTLFRICYHLGAQERIAKILIWG